MMQGFHAAQHGLPSLPFPLPLGSEIVARSGFATPYPDPVTGTAVGAARALPLDVFLLHAQRADADGNVEIQGGRGLDLSCIFAAREVMATVEEIVPAGKFQLGAAPRSFILPRSFVTGIAQAPFGAYPTSCLPYYPTDYRELLRLTGSDRLEIERPDQERRTFLSGAASLLPERVTAPILLQHCAGEDEPSDATTDEVMVTWLARQRDNTSICSVGSGSALGTVAYLLAKRTHAPDLVLMTLAEPLDFQTAAVHCGGDESYHSYYQRGRVTHEVVSAAQIDRHGNTNNIEVVSPNGRRI